VLAEFVSDLAALPRIVTVGNVSLQPRDDGELVMSAVVNTYRYLDEEEISAAQAEKGEPVRTVRQ
jgi:type IV pilus assembly protein PilO